MPAELTESPAEPRPTPHVSRWWAVRDVVMVLAAYAVGGVACGLLWQWWWTPPTGVVLDGVWYPDLDGARHVFSGTGSYVAVAAAGGLVLGAASAWLVDRIELLTLVSAVAGSALAAWVMVLVGTASAPPDPQVEARSAADDTVLRGTLEITGTSPYTAFPLGTTAGLAAVFIGLTPNRRTRQ